MDRFCERLASVVFVIGGLMIPLGMMAQCNSDGPPGGATGDDPGMAIAFLGLGVIALAVCIYGLAVWLEKDTASSTGESS